MENFNKIRSQFHLFIKENKEVFNSYEKRIINIVIDNFDNVATRGTAAGKRASFLNELLDKHRNTVNDELDRVEEPSTGTKTEISKIYSLEIQNFRGFEQKEDFTFDKSKILVYGPNGSGKSSFCEALEFGMLGYINEAETRRIPIETYIKNINTESKAIIKLTGINKEGKFIEILPDPINFHFCFIEKNRLIDFGRISSISVGERKSLLATLFGLDDFNEFIGGFTKNINEYIPTESAKAKILEERRKELTGSNQIIKTGIEDLKSITNEKLAVVNESKITDNFIDLNLYLNGNTEKEGRIAIVDRELQSILPKKYDFETLDKVFVKISDLRGNIEKFKEIDLKYQKEKDQINLRNIFEIVKNYENLMPDKCPVCETFIKDTKVNPYENARIKLKALEKVAEIEKEREAYWRLLLADSPNFAKDFSTRIAPSTELGKNISIEIPSDLFNLGLNTIGNKNFIEKLESFLDNIETNRMILVDLDLEFKKFNDIAQKFSENKIKLKEEKDVLYKLSIKVAEIITKEKVINESINKSNLTIKEFDDKNKILIEETKKEEIVTEENKKYVESYNSLIGKLNDYKDALPISLIKNLNDLTKEFYNAVNHGDKKFELLERIELPSIPDQRIKVWFQDEPNREVDPMHILSEGHIRCLGLSILLAKAVNDNLNFIVFDDIVNAIDNDHRGRIRELLFNNIKLRDKQIILTSHSEAYIREIENKHFIIGDYKTDVKQITFIKEGKKIIQRLDLALGYILRAQEYFSRNDKKNTLLNCRRALENLTDILWTKLQKKNIPLTIIMRGPKTKPELLGLVNSLRSKLEKINSNENTSIIEALKWFEGLEQTQNIVWTYLNKGTHEEEGMEDFDETIVKEVLDNTIKIDILLKTNK